KEEAKLPPKPTITPQQVESLINLFRSKTADNKERQTKFLEELDKIMEKKGIKEKTTSGNFRERLSEIEKYNKLRVLEEVAQRKKRQKFSEEQVELNEELTDEPKMPKCGIITYFANKKQRDEMWCGQDLILVKHGLKRE
ncbi:13444_t:CDS:2, partial [Cetraspora pellucida]